MRNGFAAMAVVAAIALFGQARAQTGTEMLEHLDDLGRTNEKLQQRVRTLEDENKILRERLRQLGAAEPAPSPVVPQSQPSAGRANVQEPSPAPRTLPMQPPKGTTAVPINSTIDLDSDPQGAQVATSLGSGCETPCAMEIAADGPFTVTFTHPGYEQSTVSVSVHAAQPGVSNPKFSPNPVFVQLIRQAKKKSAVSGPQKLGPAR